MSEIKLRVNNLYFYRKELKIFKLIQEEVLKYTSFDIYNDKLLESTHDIYLEKINSDIPLKLSDEEYFVYKYFMVMDNTLMLKNELTRLFEYADFFIEFFDVKKIMNFENCKEVIMKVDINKYDDICSLFKSMKHSNYCVNNEKGKNITDKTSEFNFTITNRYIMEKYRLMENYFDDEVKMSEPCFQDVEDGIVIDINDIVFKGLINKEIG